MALLRLPLPTHVGLPDTSKGKPLRFIHGHQNRRSPVDWVAEDRGYESPCWIWQLGKGTLGYGITRRGVRDGKRAQAAHRFYYEQSHGPIAADLDLHHKCEQRDCVNPGHLEPVTTAEHLRQHAVLTWDAVREIRARYSPGLVTRRMLADEYGVGESAIKKVVSNETWIEPQGVTT